MKPMRDIENPMVEQMERLGFPDMEYVEFEREEEQREEVREIERD